MKKAKLSNAAKIFEVKKIFKNEKNHKSIRWNKKKNKKILL